METERIKEIREGKRKAAERKLANFQASGYGKYYTEYSHYDDLVSICDIALSVSDIKSQNTKLMLIFNDLVEAAKKLDRYPDYDDMKLFISKFLDACYKNGFRRE